MRINKFHFLVLVYAAISVIAVPMLQGQSATSDEIKIATQPYQPEENGTIKVQSTIVDMTVVVRDRDGKLVTGLKEEDFEIYDQGEKAKCFRIYDGAGAPARHESSGACRSRRSSARPTASCASAIPGVLF